MQSDGDRCLVLKYQIQSGNCVGKTFTCQIKNPPALPIFSDSRKSVTINTVTGSKP